MSNIKETYSKEETEARREAALKRMLATPPKKNAGPSDYVMIDGALYAAVIREKSDRTMVADLYRNDADYRAGRAMERSVLLDLNQLSPAQ